MKFEYLNYKIELNVSKKNKDHWKVKVTAPDGKIVHKRGSAFIDEETNISFAKWLVHQDKKENPQRRQTSKNLIDWFRE